MVEIIKKKGKGPKSMKRAFDPLTAEKELMRTQRIKRFAKDAFRDANNFGRGRGSGYYRDGGYVITGRD